MVVEKELNQIITGTEVSRLGSRNHEFNSEYFVANLSMAQLEFRNLNGEAARRPVTAAIRELSLLPANDTRKPEYEQMVDKAIRDLGAVLCAPFHPVIYIDGQGLVPAETHFSPSYLAPHLSWGCGFRNRH